MEDLYEGGKENPTVAKCLAATAQLRHPAPLVLYKNYKSEPVLLKDKGCDASKDDPELFSYRGYDYMKLTDKASATKDPVEREMLEHFLTVECLMYNRGKGLTTWTFEDA